MTSDVQNMSIDESSSSLSVPPSAETTNLSSPSHRSSSHSHHAFKQQQQSLTPATLASLESSPCDSSSANTSMNVSMNMASLLGVEEDEHEDSSSPPPANTSVDATTTTTAASTSAAAAVATPSVAGGSVGGGETGTSSSGHNKGSSSSSSNNGPTVWVPVPSPSRPRLDPRYAARLAPVFTQQSPHPTPQQAQRTASTTSTGSSNNETDLMPPPNVTRDSSHRNFLIFRPSPILTTDVGDEDVDVPSKLPQQPTHAGQKHSHSNYFANTSPTYSTTSSSDSTNFMLPSSSSTPVRRSSSSAMKRSATAMSSSYTTASTGSLSSRSSSFASSLTVPSPSDSGVSDRFIASRATSNFSSLNLWEGIAQRSESTRAAANAASASTNNSTAGSTATTPAPSDGLEGETFTNQMQTTAAYSQQNLLNTLLRSELLGENENSLPHSLSGSPATTPTGSSTPRGFSSSSNNSSNSNSSQQPLRDGGNSTTTTTTSHLRFTSPRQAYQENVFENAVGPTAVVNSFSLTPVRSAASQRLMAAPPKRKRRISKVPFKVLDAPALQDDFYLNLVDWSSQNVLAVGLGSCVYLWSACTSKVTKLCDLEGSEDVVTSVSWAQRGTHLAVGTNRGEVQLWDTIRSKKVRAMSGHSARVGALAWTGPILASGSRDRLIYLRDVRVQASFTDKLSNHKQEVCGLKWSFDEPAFLASGGNDNHLHVIDSRNPGSPIHKFSEHTAAVKAITWSPHQHGLLASGGGTADRCIRFWNTLSGVGLNKIDTGSQVCNIAWSQNCNEIVSTHGYSLNQIVVWRYPSMSKVVTLTGHTYRVLYLAMSPDGSTVVTGAGDETLRFWQIFPGPRSGEKDVSGGLLFPNTLGSVIR